MEMLDVLSSSFSVRSGPSRRRRRTRVRSSHHQPATATCPVRCASSAGDRSDSVTHSTLLRPAGYVTAYIGKWHMGNQSGQRPGFDYFVTHKGQGKYFDTEFNVEGKRETLPGYYTHVVTDYALDWLKQRDKSKPFLLMCQHKAPHREWEPALRHLNADGDRVYPEPATLFDDYSGRGAAEREQDMTIDKTMGDKDTKLIPPPQLTPEQAAAVRAAHGLSADTPLVLYTGTFEAYQGLDLLFGAMAAVRTRRPDARQHPRASPHPSGAPRERPCRRCSSSPRRSLLRIPRGFPSRARRRSVCLGSRR